MCKFCVEHGEGERWYLQAQNYAYDLESDIKRRTYVVDFITGFADTRASTLKWMDRMESWPTPLAQAAKSAVSRYMQPHHFGQPVPIEDCARIFDLATSITAIPCICRMHAPGKHADEVCILVTTQAMEPYLAEGFKGYEDGPDLDDFHTLTKDEAMRLVQQCEHDGLMHSVWTFQTPFTAAICNCNLDSGCMAMRLTAGYGMPLMWRGETVARLDAERCVNCGACAKICPFSAIQKNGRVTIPAEKCWGCGICRSVCTRNAISLVDRRSVPEVAGLW